MTGCQGTEGCKLLHELQPRIGSGGRCGSRIALTAAKQCGRQKSVLRPPN
jgi:hypothetical protein